MPESSPLDDHDITELRDAVLRWVDAKKNESSQSSAGAVTTPAANEVSASPGQTLAAVKLAKILPTRSKRPHKFLITIIGVLLALLLIVGLMIYYLPGENQLVRTITRAIPVPAAIVNTDVVTYYDWMTQVEALRNFYKKTAAPEQRATLPTISDLKRSVLNRLIEQQLVKQLAKSYTVSVSAEDVAKQLQLLANNIGSPEALTEQIKNFYGWDIQYFQGSVIEPLLLRNKLELALTLDDRQNHDARVKAEAVLKLVKTSDRTFEQLAEQYSQDVTAVQGGDLGYFKPSDLGPEFTQALAALSPGEISELVKTKYGYHILKLIERLTGDQDSESQVHTKQILIRGQGLTDYLTDYRNQSFIWQLVVIK